MPSDFQTAFYELISVADSQRHGYRASLGDGIDPNVIVSTIPKGTCEGWLVDIYSIVSGTPRDIKNQALMDLIPGYRLVQIHETSSASLWEGKQVVPLLANYSCDYIAFLDNDESLWRINHDDDVAYRIYDSPATFVQSSIECFFTSAYFLDQDGYLDYNDAKVSDIASRLNPNSDYWK